MSKHPVLVIRTSTYNSPVRVFNMLQRGGEEIFLFKEKKEIEKRKGLGRGGEGGSMVGKA